MTNRTPAAQRAIGLHRESWGRTGCGEQGPRSSQPDRRAHRLQRRVRTSDGDRVRHSRLTESRSKRSPQHSDLGNLRQGSAGQQTRVDRFQALGLVCLRRQPLAGWTRHFNRFMELLDSNGRPDRSELVVIRSSGSRSGRSTAATRRRELGTCANCPIVSTSRERSRRHALRNHGSPDLCLRNRRSRFVDRLPVARCPASAASRRNCDGNSRHDDSARTGRLGLRRPSFRLRSGGELARSVRAARRAAR